MTKKSAGPVYLLASSQPATFKTIAARAMTAIARKPARIAASFASAGAPATHMTSSLHKAFAGAEVTRFTVKGEAGAMPADEARAIVERADLVFLGGGDPIHGAHLLANAGADKWIRDAHARGAACMGISAGAIQLCAWWASWPDDPLPGDAHEGGELVACAGVVADLVVDCHAESDQWNELKLVHAMLAARCAREPGLAMPRFLGLPTGSALVLEPGRPPETVGGAPFRLT